MDSIGFDLIAGGLALGVPFTIYVIRRRWAAREAAGNVAIATWWEAIVHALAVSAAIALGLIFAVLFLFRDL